VNFDLRNIASSSSWIAQGFSRELRCELKWPVEICLRPEFAELIKQDVQRGPYETVDEFVEQAVSKLHEQEVWLAANRAEIQSNDWRRLRHRPARRVTRSRRGTFQTRRTLNENDRATSSAD